MTIKDLKDQGLILFECISGSKAFGLDTPTSDTDIKGVFYLPKDRFFSNTYISQVSNETNDIVYYEIGRFIELLTKNNPNILELLATGPECVLLKHPLIDKLKLSDFISKLCRDTFGGYAITQIKKAKGLNKKMMNPVSAERRSLLDFCYVLDGAGSIPAETWLRERGMKQEHCGLTKIPNARGLFALFYDESSDYRGIISGTEANEVSLTSITEHESPLAYMFCNADAYSIYCKEYREYWDWVDKRNNIRFAGNLQHGKDYDAKNMMHTIRLLQVAEEIGRTGNFNVRRSNRIELLDIKAGKFEYDELLEMAEKIVSDIEYAFTISTLRDKPDSDEAERILIKIREELYATTANTTVR